MKTYEGRIFWGGFLWGVACGICIGSMMWTAIGLLCQGVG